MSSVLVEQYMTELETFLGKYTKEEVRNTTYMEVIMQVQTPMIKLLHLLAVGEGLNTALHKSYIELFRMADDDLTVDDIKELFARSLGYKDHAQAVAFAKNATTLTNRRYITHH